MTTIRLQNRKRKELEDFLSGISHALDFSGVLFRTRPESKDRTALREFRSIGGEADLQALEKDGSLLQSDWDKAVATFMKEYDGR